MSYQIMRGDVLDRLRELPDESVHCVVTSPPYWGLRDYGCKGQIGLEKTPGEFIAKMTDVFREVRRVLRADGTCWVNMGDAYAGHNAPGWRDGNEVKNGGASNKNGVGYVVGLKPKDLMGMPWRLAFALQEDGWWLRQDIIWCLSGGAWVYARTQKGEMPVMVKDLVRLPTTSVQLWNGHKWTRVRSWTKSDAAPGGVEIVLRSGERVTCTATHYWPTQRGNVPASDLQIGDVIATCTLPEPSGPQPNFLTHDALWLLGLYLAEGSRADDTIQLALHADEMGWLPMIETIAQHYGGSCTHTLDGNTLCVRLYGRVLNALIDTYIAGEDATTKHMKVAAWALTNTALRSMARGYLNGDGHADEKNGRFRLGFTRNYALERDLRVLAARLGATLTLRPTTVNGFGKEWPAFRGEWRWTRNGHHNEKARSEIVAIRNGRARRFWDIEVEDDPHLFSLASGVLTHNSKPNPMPESVLDRCTKAHEYIFLLTKSARYFYDAEAIKEPAGGWNGSEFHDGKNLINHPNVGKSRPGGKKPDQFDNLISGAGRSGVGEISSTRNKRSVWEIATEPFAEAHFATYPTKLVEPCILAGSPLGGMVLDPFSGSGTTGLVALELGREYIGIELNPEYADMSERRLGEASAQERLFSPAEMASTTPPDQIDMFAPKGN